MIVVAGVSVLEVALWVVVAGMSVWILGPVVGYLWKGRQLGVEVYAEPPLARPYPEDADGLRRHQEFIDLGYRPVGSTYESARFFTPMRWRWRSRGSRWLAAADWRTFVHLHRLVDDEPVRMGAVTVFEGGGTWRAACPGVASELPEVPGIRCADRFGAQSSARRGRSDQEGVLQDNERRTFTGRAMPLPGALGARGFGKRRGEGNCR